MDRKRRQRCARPLIRRNEPCVPPGA